MKGEGGGCGGFRAFGRAAGVGGIVLIVGEK